MKHINRRSSHGHHDSKRREMAQHAHSHGSHAVTHNNSYNHVVRNASSAIIEFGIEFLSLRYLREGEKPEYPEKTPDSLPANRYHI